MTLMVRLPNGANTDLAETAVIRSVGENESNSHNEQLLEFLKGRPNFDGVVPSTRWTIAIERKGLRPLYTTGDVAQLVAAVNAHALANGAKKEPFKLIDANRAAIASDAKAILIRPLAAREGSEIRATVWIEGGSSNGLFVTRDATAIKSELGASAAHLAAIGDEGFIDRKRIARVNAFDQERDLKEGQQRFTTAVRFDGVYRPQYFKATEQEIYGSPVLNLAAGAPARPAAGQKGGAVSAPEVR